MRTIHLGTRTWSHCRYSSAPLPDHSRGRTLISLTGFLRVVAAFIDNFIFWADSVLAVVAGTIGTGEEMKTGIFFLVRFSSRMGFLSRLAVPEIISSLIGILRTLYLPRTCILRRKETRTRDNLVNNPPKSQFEFHRHRLGVALITLLWWRGKVTLRFHAVSDSDSYTYGRFGPISGSIARSTFSSVDSSPKIIRFSTGV